LTSTREPSGYDPCRAARAEGTTPGFDDHVSVITVETVSTGVIPAKIEMGGLSGPKYKISPAPVEASPREKNCSVSLPPVAVGKMVVLVNVAVPPETVNPALVRGSDTRA